MREDYKRYVRSFEKTYSVSTKSTKADVWLKKTQSNFDNNLYLFLTKMILLKAIFELISVPTRHELKYASTTYD